MQNSEELLIVNYWHLREMSVADLGDKALDQVFRDIYTLQCSLETFHLYKANGFFGSELEAKQYINRYITPLLYTHKILKKLRITSYPTKTLRSFMHLYSESLPALKNFQKVCKKAGLRVPNDYSYNISKKWYKYDRPIKTLKSKILITDWKISNE